MIIYYFIKRWFSLRFSAYYYKTHGIKREDVLDIYRTDSDIYKLGHILGVNNAGLLDYYYFILGMYVSHMAASVSSRTYINLVTTAPLLVQHDDEKLLKWLGETFYDYSSFILSGRDYKIILENISTINVCDKKVYSGPVEMIDAPSLSRENDTILVTYMARAWDKIKSELPEERYVYWDDYKPLYSKTDTLRMIALRRNMKNLSERIKDVQNNYKPLKEDSWR